VSTNDQCFIIKSGQTTSCLRSPLSCINPISLDSIIKHWSAVTSRSHKLCCCGRLLFINIIHSFCVDLGLPGCFAAFYSNITVLTVCFADFAVSMISCAWVRNQLRGGPARGQNQKLKYWKTPNPATQPPSLIRIY
jgi:hypothetical protein